MEKLKFEVPNSLPIDEAKKRVEALLSYWSKKYGVTIDLVRAHRDHERQSDGRVHRRRARGRGHAHRGEASDPGMLLRGQAQKYLIRKFGEYLDPRRSVDDILKDEQ